MKTGSKEGQTHDAASHRISSPTHYQQSNSIPTQLAISQTSHRLTNPLTHPPFYHMISSALPHRQVFCFSGQEKTGHASLRMTGCVAALDPACCELWSAPLMPSTGLHSTLTTQEYTSRNIQKERHYLKYTSQYNYVLVEIQTS